MSGTNLAPLMLLSRFCLACLAFASLAALTADAAKAQAMPFDNSRMEDIAGVQVHVREWSPQAGITSRCPVLLVHGFAGSTFSFRYLAPALARQGHRVIAIDLPAYGHSERRPFPATASEALWPWLAAQDGRRWCLLGHSMGARIVGELVMLKPTMVSAAIYVDGSPIPSAREIERRKKYSSPTIRRWMAGFAERFYLSESRIAEMLGKAYGRKPDAEEVRGYYLPLKKPGTALAIMNGYSARWPPNPTPEGLDALPSLILWGEKDAWVKPEVGTRLAKQLPNARKVRIAGAGHCPMETHPDDTSREILSFLSAKTVAGNP